jgi:transposase
MTIGVDVSKDNLAVYGPSGSARTIPNSMQGITRLLGSLESGSTIAMEATGPYHKRLADAAFSRGFKVIVFNPKDVLHFARSVSPRAKTDNVDAMVIAGYAQLKSDHRAYQPLSPEAAKLRDLLRTRTLLVRDRTGLTNRLHACPESARHLTPVIEGINASITQIDKDVAALARTFTKHKLLEEMPGVGPVVSAYLLALLMSGTFRSSDSFVAYIGLDIRVRQSGKKTGRSCLSKRGDPEARRLLYLAARATCRNAGPFHDLYERYRTKGMSKIAAAVAVSRKIARTAWALYTKNEPYCPERVLAQGHGA